MQPEGTHCRGAAGSRVRPSTALSDLREDKSSEDGGEKAAGPAAAAAWGEPADGYKQARQLGGH